MKKTESEKTPGKRSILRIVTDLLRSKGHEEITAIASPPPETVERLLEKATGGESAPEEKVEEEKKSCPYATKRAIVESLQEIRRFAEEHQLAATAVKAILTLLAEIALDSLKGRVSGRILEALWKAVSYDRDRKEAFNQGRKEGRNDTIGTVIFADGDKDLPDINGAIFTQDEAPTTIFDIAREAGNNS